MLAALIARLRCRLSGHASPTLASTSTGGNQTAPESARYAETSGPPPWPAAMLTPHPSAERHLTRRRILSFYFEADRPMAAYLYSKGWPAYT